MLIIMRYLFCLLTVVFNKTIWTEAAFNTGLSALGIFLVITVVAARFPARFVYLVVVTLQV